MSRSPVIGLVVNPQAGRDIRRLIAYASVFDNSEKMNIVRKLVMTLLDFGINRYLVMPEPDGIIETALRTLPEDVLKELDVEFVPIRVTGTWVDTYNAIRYMNGRVNSVIILGGDGTNRVVAKAGVDVPIMPISTGTNNVFPYMVEATVAAEAVAAIVLGYVNVDEGTFRAKVIRIYEDGEYVDTALVDAVSTMYQYVGARAIWEPEYLNEVFAVLSAPYNIGLSTIAGVVKEITHGDDIAVYVRLSRNNTGRSYRVAIMPGRLVRLNVVEFREVRLNERVEFDSKSTLIALDGEREFLIPQGSNVSAEAKRDGPWVIDYKKTLQIASGRGFFESLK